LDKATEVKMSKGPRIQKKNVEWKKGKPQIPINQTMGGAKREKRQGQPGEGKKNREKSVGDWKSSGGGMVGIKTGEMAENEKVRGKKKTQKRGKTKGGKMAGVKEPSLGGFLAQWNKKKKKTNKPRNCVWAFGAEGGKKGVTIKDVKR